jgi:hypothetical protein
MVEVMMHDSEARPLKALQLPSCSLGSTYNAAAIMGARLTSPHEEALSGCFAQ